MYIKKVRERIGHNRERITKDICFACASPYHLIGAISIIQKLGKNADLYIFGTFQNSKEVARRIQDFNLFSKVIHVDSNEFGGHGKWMALKKVLFPDRVVALFMDSSISYLEYYMASFTSLLSAQIKVLRDRNPNMQIVMFEDGLGTYADYGRLIKSTPLRTFAEKLLGWGRTDPQKMKFMVFLPSLFKKPEGYEECMVEAMPNPELSLSNRDLFESIFSVDEGKRINSRYIIFDTHRSGNPSVDKIDQQNLDVLDSCYELILRILGDDVICKPHPKSKLKIKSDINTYEFQEIPMEVLFAGMLDLEKRVLISFASTSLFTPKVLFNQEPTVISLYKIVNAPRISNAFDAIFHKFKETYRHKERVFAPASLEELESICRDLIM